MKNSARVRRTGNMRNYSRERILESESGKATLDKAGYSMTQTRKFFGLKIEPTKKRMCLGCKRDFESEHKGNRCCEGCKNLSSRYGY